jgi:hypothetical protein
VLSATSFIVLLLNIISLQYMFWPKWSSSGVWVLKFRSLLLTVIHFIFLLLLLPLVMVMWVAHGCKYKGWALKSSPCTTTFDDLLCLTSPMVAFVFVCFTSCGCL